MNVDVLVDWAHAALRIVDGPSLLSPLGWRRAESSGSCGWLADFRAETQTGRLVRP
jgi:hypothetical protein